jgi:hypothetical protein
MRQQQQQQPTTRSYNMEQQLLNDETERHYIAYAVGYADGNTVGEDRRRNNFVSPEEQYLYNAGYESGLSDFPYYKDYGRFDD